MSLLDIFKKKNKIDKMKPSSIIPKEVYTTENLDLKDIIAPSALKISPKEIHLGDKIVRSFFVISYPRFLGESWFAPIINLDKIFNISIFIHPLETSKILRTYQKKVVCLRFLLIPVCCRIGLERPPKTLG